jgi:hypothetical protein
MTEDFKKWWLHYVESQTPEGYFYLPQTPRSIDELTPEEFEIYMNNDCELITDNPYGISYFLCKKDDENEKDN